MTRRLRRDIRLLQAYATVSSLLLVWLAVSAFRQANVAPGGQRIEEITVQRLNVVDGNGTLRLVLAGKDRMHPGVLDGKVIDRPRPVAGMLFFNDEGDEVGGLTITGQERDGARRANALLAFDQLKQDQTIAIAYSEQNGQRSTGLTVWDRPETRLSDLIDKLNAANKLPDAEARREGRGCRTGVDAAVTPTGVRWQEHRTRRGHRAGRRRRPAAAQPARRRHR